MEFCILARYQSVAADEQLQQLEKEYAGRIRTRITDTYWRYDPEREMRFRAVFVDSKDATLLPEIIIRMSEINRGGGKGPLEISVYPD